MDPINLLLWGVLPAIVVSLLALAAILQPRTLPALFTAGAYLASYLWLIRVPQQVGDHPAPPETWHVMLPAAVMAAVGATLVELLPERWHYRLSVFAIIALVLSWQTAPRADLVAPYHAFYILLPAAAALAIFACLRLPSPFYPPPASPLILCLTSFLTGVLLVAIADNAKPAQPALVLSVPLGAFAFFTLFRPLRVIAAAAITPAALILPNLLTLGYFYNEPSDATLPPTISRWTFLLLTLAPTAALLALVPPIRRRPWLAIIAPAVLTLLILAAALYLAHVTVAAPPEF